jgi:hypothetical protein
LIKQRLRAIGSRMRAGLIIAFACFSSACASSQAPALIDTCSEYKTPRADPNAARPTIDQVRAQAHALFAALDRADEAAFKAELGETFALIDSGVVRDRAFLLDDIRARVARSAPPRTRSWQNEKVWVSDAAAVFVGESVVHEQSDLSQPNQPGGDFGGWNTLVFAPERGSFRAVSWQWVALP